MEFQLFNQSDPLRVTELVVCHVGWFKVDLRLTSSL